MITEKTQQDNKLIARFMGLKGTDGFLINNYSFHSNWSLLMPVVEKIETLYHGGLQFYIKDNRAYIEVDTQASICYDDIPDVPNCYSGFRETKIDAVYTTVVGFIQWYNENQKHP